jgi:3-oxoacyl-[acyl-carrier protein] reductase
VTRAPDLGGLPSVVTDSSRVSEYGGIGLLVNNAGVARDRSLTRMTTAEWDEVIAVHLRGTWACAAAAARAMRASAGAILNITSGAGLFGTFGQAKWSCPGNRMSRSR